MTVPPPSTRLPAGSSRKSPLGWLRAILPFTTVLGALVACCPAHAGHHPTVVQDSTYRSVSEFGPDTLLVRELVFESPVLTAQIDESNGDLVVAVKRTRPADPRSSSSISSPSNDPQIRLLAYDMQAHRVMWERPSGLLPVTAGASRAVLSKGDERFSLIRVEDGEELANITGMALVWSDGVALRVTDGEFGRWDLESGRDLWRANRGTGGSFDNVIRRDSVAYLVADGIQKFDLRDGPLWSYSARANRKGLYADPDGGTVQVRSLYGGSRATHLTATPLIRDSYVYFAADTTVVMLDAGSGDVRWSQHLTRPRGFSLKQRALGTPGTAEFLGRLVLRDAGRNILVASLGWASGPKYNLIADPPTVALLAKSDGHVVARVQVPGVSFLSDALSTPFGNFVLSSDRVVALDDSLRVRATLEAPMDLQPLGQFIEVGDAIVLTVGPGIAALSSDSLRVVWSRRCGRMLAIEPNVSASRARYCVTTQGLIRLDKGAGLLPNAYYPLRSSWAELRGDWLVMGAGTRVRVVTLLAHQPAPRVD